MSRPVVRDLRLVSASSRARLLDTVRQAWSDWSAGCLPTTSSWVPTFEMRVVAETGLTMPLGDWQVHGTQEVIGWSQWTEQGRQQLAARMVQRATSAAPLSESDWALHAADEAWRALNARLLGPVMATTCENSTRPDGRAWSGVVFIEEPVLGARWAWRLSAHAQAPKPDASVGRSVITCLLQRTLHLQAELDEVDITLADLLTLQVGDVVRFPAAANQGVPFTFGETSRAAGRGQLGLIDGHLALRLSPSNRS